MFRAGYLPAENSAATKEAAKVYSLTRHRNSYGTRYLRPRNSPESAEVAQATGTDGLAVRLLKWLYHPSSMDISRRLFDLGYTLLTTSRQTSDSKISQVERVAMRLRKTIHGRNCRRITGSSQTHHDLQTPLQGQSTRYFPVGVDAIWIPLWSGYNLVDLVRSSSL